MGTPANLPPNPLLFFEAMQSYQRTASIRAALELGVFSVIDPEGSSADEIAARCQADGRGMRILADFLCIHGFLVKQAECYRNTTDSAMFLDRRSTAYMGAAAEFMLSPSIAGAFNDLAQCVRTGTTTLSAAGTMEADHPVWVTFARVMGPVIGMPAPALAAIGDPSADAPLRVLDVAAGHGLFGIAFARRNVQAQVVALDWEPVLAVACEHAGREGVTARYSTIAGDAFNAELGAAYDVILLTNFLHHFDEPTCVAFLRRMAGALNPGGRVLTLEFVPNEDRISPPPAAAFALTMLATTTGGDAYPFSAYERMFRAAGLADNSLHVLPQSAQSVIVSRVAG